MSIDGWVSLSITVPQVVFSGQHYFVSGHGIVVLVDLVFLHNREGIKMTLKGSFIMNFTRLVKTFMLKIYMAYI